MREIYLDNYHLHSLTTELPTRVRQPLPGLEAPEERVDVYNNAGEHGQTVSNTLSGGRTVVLEGSIRGRGTTEAAVQADYRAQRQALIAATSNLRDDIGSPIPRILRMTDLTGTTYRLSVIKRKLVMPETLPTFTTWMLELVATHFAIEADVASSGTVTLPIAGGVKFPVSFPLSFGASSGGLVTLYNPGSAPAFPVITIRGPINNPLVTNETNGNSIGVNLNLLSGDAVVIDMLRRTIVQGKSTNRMGSVSRTTFWALTPGENVVRLTASSYDTGSATLDFRTAWWGI